MTKTLEIKRVSSDADMHLALTLRNKVFVQEQKIDASIEIDGKDDKAIHILALLNDHVVATARLNCENNTGIIARVAVEQQYRGQGLGQKLVKALEDIAMEESLEILMLEPHAYLESFYSSLGFTVIPGAHTKVNEHELICMQKLI